MPKPSLHLRSSRFFAASLAIALFASLVPLAAVSAADTLSFTQGPPVTAQSGVAFPITVNDSAGNGIPITLALINGTPGATLTCTPTNPATTAGAGDATFSCKVDKVGVNYRLHATAPGAQNKNSLQFDVVAGAADHMIFSSYPASPTPNLLSPQPAVTVVDAAGNTVITDSGRNITLTDNVSNGTFTCTTNQTRQTVNGVATWTGCTQTTGGTGHSLTATTTGLTTNTVTGPLFTVASGPATHLQICWGTAAICNTTPPATVTGGVAFSLQPEVRVLDASNNTVATDNTTVVTLSILSGTPTSGGPGTLTCTGGLSKTVTAGVADFAGCSIDKPGVGYKLNASSTPVLTTAQTNAFTVTTGPATKLVFTVQPPATATAGVPFPGNIQVSITDAGGNVVSTGITATVALSIGTNPGAGTLSCTGGNSATTVSGVATFTGCTISSAGNGYTLIATATATAPVTALAPATSTAINVSATPASITLTPSSTVITWGEGVSFTAHFGGNGANRQFTLQVSKDGVNFSNIAGATLTTDVSGNATFTYRPSDNRYYRAAFAGAGDLTASNSNIVRVVVRQINILRPNATSTYKAISRGTAITFTSTIRPNRPELPQAIAHFVVYQLGASGWTQVLDRMVPVNRANGVASLQVTFNTAGKFYARAQAVPTTFNANSVWSGLDRYNVQ